MLMRYRRRRSTGLGAERTLSRVGQTELAIAPMTGPAAPFVAAAGALHMLLGKVFGPDPMNVPAATIEQIYEAAADNAYALARAGMITVDQAIGAEQQFLSMLAQHIGGASLGNAGKRAIANGTKVIQAEIAATQKLKSNVTQAIDLNVAHGLYKTGAGWYPEAVASAAQLMDQFLQSLGGSGAVAGPAASGATSAATPAGIVAAISQPVGGIPAYFWLIGAGVAVLALSMSGGQQR